MNSIVNRDSGTSSSRAAFVQPVGWLILTITIAAAFLFVETAHCQPVASDSFDYPTGKLTHAMGGVGFQSRPAGWKGSSRNTVKVVDSGLTYPLADSEIGTDGGAVEIRGLGSRDNPLRRPLADAFSGDELFVRFLLRYDGDTIDQAKASSPKASGEFFVLWLDDIDGSDGATHNTNVPNIGLHVPTVGANKGKNLFMVRIGASQQRFADVELEGDKTYLIVGRLSKSSPGIRGEYDSFSLWVNPKPTDLDTPLATSRSKRGINLVQWVGFATGLKTEPDDRIKVDELALAKSWHSVLNLPEPESKEPSRPLLAEINFRRDVYPILQKRCFDCHQGADAYSSVRLDVREELLGHSSGSPAIVPGKSAESRLIELITMAEDVEEKMPPEGDRLPQKEIDTLAAWIDQGMAWDEALLPSPKVESDHWAFQPIKRPEVPEVKNKPWVANPIDSFISAGHQRQQLHPAAPAGRGTLLRRLSFDLTGLPPKPEEIERFENDTAADAYAKVVQHLLSSPDYGERWGRHWLDVARWAESNGHQHNNVRRHSWRYRDYVVQSFNEDKPYDQFLREQIAGDQLAAYDDNQLVATGFLAAARVSGNEMNPMIRRNDILVDIVNATASGVMGLTIQCAQCHNHKFDPISARDYYRLQAFFAKGQLGNLVLKDAWAKADPHRKAKPTDRPQTFGYYAPSLSPTKVDRLPMEKIRYRLPYDPARLASERTYLLIRGDVDSPGPIVEPGWPEVFGPVADQQQLNKRPRLALVDWLVDRENPLTARVWVNRIWHYHFGRGLVAEMDDFGVRTESPVQRDLLDWLAVELIESGWRTKHIHRLIVHSNTYQQSANFNQEFAEIDPENQYYWRWSPRRLEAEAIRDAVLAVSGELNRHRGGPSVVATSEQGRLRRSLYLQQRRQKLPEMQTLFDGTQAVVSCGRRRVSTVPLQPLYMLNSDFMLKRAQAFANRVVANVGDDRQRQVAEVFRLALGREPDAAELSQSLAFLSSNQTHGTDEAASDHVKLVHFCHAVINLNEFVYIN